MKSVRHRLGFTLIEVMIAMVIIGVLVAIAYPAYQSHIIKTRRVDGQTALYNLATMMEHYYTENNTYVGATLATFGFTAASPQGFYTISITNQTATAFTVSAAPTGVQTQDTTCGTLTLTNTNIKAPNPTTCWD